MAADIYVFAANATNTGTIGICGSLFPNSCEFEDVGNGMSEITLVHPIDEWGKYKNLVINNLLSIEVPVRTTPEIGSNGTIVTNVETWTVLAGERSNRTIYKKSTGDAAVKLLSAGTKVTVTKRTTDGRYKVKTSKYSGWMEPDGLQRVSETTISDSPTSIESVVPAWEYRRQLFRIYSVEASTGNGITVKAKHIFYDLLYNITTYEQAASYTLPAALNGILENCIDDHGFNAYTNIGGTHTGALYMDYDPVTAVLDPDVGLCANWNAQLVRDNYDFFLLHEAGMDRGVTIEYGKNLKGVQMSTDISNVCTRLRPIGKTKDGKPIHLTTNDGCIDSDLKENYPFDRIMTLEVSDATVDCKDVKNETEARTIMTAVAQAKFTDEHVDMPVVNVTVDFVNLGTTDEYKQFHALSNIYLYDTVHVYHKRLGIDVPATVIRTVYDCINRRMKTVELGKMQALTPSVSGWQISGGITGAKIVDGAIGADKLKADSIDARHIQASSITTEALNAEAVTADKIKAGAIGATQIDAGSVSAAVLSAEQAQLTIASVVQASIGTANIGYAQIKDASAESLFVKDGNADEYYVQKLRATSAQMLDLVVGNLVFKGDDDLYYTLSASTAADGTVSISATQYTDGVDEDAGTSTDGSRSLIEGVINANELTAGSIHAADAVITRIQSDKLWSNEAFIHKLTTQVIYGENGTLLLMASNLDEVREIVSVESDGVYIREKNGSGQLKLDSGAVTIGQQGYGGYAEFDSDSITFGNYELRKSVDGGLVFKLKEDS